MNFDTKGYVRKLRAQIKEIKKRDKLIFEAASTVHGQYITRIFVQGRTSQGGAIGNYASSTKKIRQKRGRQTSFVDLTFTARLRQNVTNSLSKDGDKFVVGTTRVEESRKIVFLLKRYGEVTFKASKSERKLYQELIQKAFTEIMQK